MSIEYQQMLCVLGATLCVVVIVALLMIHFRDQTNKLASYMHTLTL